MLEKRLSEVKFPEGINKESFSYSVIRYKVVTATLYMYMLLRLNGGNNNNNNNNE